MRLSLTVFLALLVASPVASAAVDSSSWNRNLQRMDYYTNPPQGGDAQFFTVQAQSGVIVLIYPTKASMLGFPLALYEMRKNSGTDEANCSNNYLNALTYQLPAQNTAYSSLAGKPYSPTATYPNPEEAYAASDYPVSDGLVTGLSGYYRYRNWVPEQSGTNESALTACTNAVTATAGGADAIAACQTCLSNSGYWLNPAALPSNTTPNAAVFSTNWLRFYPPKWEILKLAYKRMVAGPALAHYREGVMVAGGAVSGDGTDGKGGYVIQKLLPQSCQGQGAKNGSGILQARLQAVEGLSYTSTAYPLAEMLFNDGYYQSGTDSTWCCSSASPSPYFTNSFVLNSSMGSDTKGGPCPGCNQDFFIIFSDGRGDSANPYCTTSTGTPPVPCQQAAQCSTLGMGLEDDGDDFLGSGEAGGWPPTLPSGQAWPTYADVCADDFAPDVAYWMAHNDMLQTSPGSSIVSFVVAIGTSANAYGAGKLAALHDVADAGKGSYLEATDFNDFEANLKQTLQEIIQRTTSFSVAAITTVQTRGSTYAFIPRFTPAQGNVWNGKLYRLGLFNEFADGCTAADYNIKDSKNPNGDASCSDVYLTDSNGAFVGDDDQGNIRPLDTSQPYPWTQTLANQCAAPYWEASQVLTDRVDAVDAGTSTDHRTIYTAYDSNGDGIPDALISFDTASTDLTILTPLLQLGGYTGSFCQEMAARTSHVYTQDSDCAADLIAYVRGQNLFKETPECQTNSCPAAPTCASNADCTGGLTCNNGACCAATPPAARPDILGDIFHSSPILEVPPVTSFLCDLGVITQCQAALYSDTLTPDGKAAYTAYQTDSTNEYRTQVLLVGANDGMLHAFNAGDDQVDGSGNHSFDYGTGREMWAFIPPDLLPKLRLYAIDTKHELFVDGTPMVRDIWVDGSGTSTSDKTYQKDADEYHTVAITGERDGGRSYFALDVTDPANPKFLWEWPPTGSTTALYAGRSWDDYAPSPPPVGPIAINDPNGPLTVAGQKAKEVWVVAVGGGYDPNYINGAGYYLLDAWTGQQIYRATRLDVPSGSSDPRASMFPIAATPSMIDRDGDGLFDTLVVGDVGGQVWVTNMMTPGAEGGNGLVTNWNAARAFIEFKSSPFYDRSPFFQMASAAVLPNGAIRVYLGSGNRDAIDDWSGTDCQLSDMDGCMRDDCSVDVNQQTFQSGSHYVDSELSYTAGATAPSVVSFSTGGAADGNAATDAATVNIGTTITCGSGGSGSVAATYSNAVTCDWGTPECTGSGKPDSTQLTYTPSITQQPARFYSILLFDNATHNPNRVPFTDAASAATYDAAALTDTDLVNADTTAATATGNGYYVQYANLPEKTSSQVLVFDGCAIVNTLLPAQPPTNYCSTTTIPKSTAYTYQADATTGAIACGTGATAQATVRSTTQSAIVPPPMPTPVVSVNSVSGTVSYGGISVVPGATEPTNLVIGGGGVIGPVEWLEVSKKMHECRHLGTNCP